MGHLTTVHMLEPLLNSKTNDVIYYSGSDWIILCDLAVTKAKALLLKVINLFVFYDLCYYTR